MSKIQWTGRALNPIRARRKDNGKTGTHCVKTSPGCKNCYAKSHKHILPEFGNSRLCDIDAEAIQVWLNKKDAEDLSWWTRNDLRNIISGLFTKAKDWGYWRDRHPTEGTTLGWKKFKREKRILTAEQTIALIEELPADIALLVRLADSTGMRQ